ncbi:helix-turn-helix transcriptional regulator [Paenibacillus rhizoplanae]
MPVFFRPEQTLLIQPERPDQGTALPKFNLTPFTEQLKRQQLAEAFGDLHQHVDALSRQNDGDVYQFKSFLGNIIFNITNQFSHLQELEEGKYGLFRAIDEADTAEQAIRILDDYLSRIMELTLSAAPAPGSNANMTKLLQYIEEHYAEPLTLTELARHFHFNPSYLSSLFTTYNHEGFKEHLNTVRTGKAAELLRAGEAPIAEISSMVGYGDHSYFFAKCSRNTTACPRAATGVSITGRSRAYAQILGAVQISQPVHQNLHRHADQHHRRSHRFLLDDRPHVGEAVHEYLQHYEFQGDQPD